MKVALLKNERESSVAKWQLACEKKKINYDIIDLTKSDWITKIKSTNFDFCLLKPSGVVSHFKQMYDERVYIISCELDLKVFPSLKETLIHENKRMLSYYLKAWDIPHPKTWVFYRKDEAKSFIRTVKCPFVAKTAVGASGSGVTILENKRDATKYIRDAFSSKGVKSRFGPNRNLGSPATWFKKAVYNPSYLLSRVKKYLYEYRRGQTDFVIFQEFVPHDYEWRIVKIGDSYFGHQKIKIGEKASGTKGIEYVEPPESILNYVKKLCDKHEFHSMAVDLFEDGKGGYLVNELQAIFGHIQDHILEVGGKPGRFIHENRKWIFEEGMFNSNESYDLRLETAIDLYKQDNL